MEIEILIALYVVFLQRLLCLRFSSFGVMICCAAFLFTILAFLLDSFVVDHTLISTSPASPSNT